MFGLAKQKIADYLVVLVVFKN